MLQNAKVTVFTVSELQGKTKRRNYPLPRLELRNLKLLLLVFFQFFSNVTVHIILKRTSYFWCTSAVTSWNNDLRQITTSPPDHFEASGNILEAFLKMH